MQYIVQKDSAGPWGIKCAANLHVQACGQDLIMTVTGKAVDNRTLPGALVALERPRSAQTCSQRPMSNVIWYLFLIKSTRAIIAATLQRKPHLPRPSTLPPALFPGLRLGWCFLALSSVPAYLGLCTSLPFFLQAPPLCGELKYLLPFFFTCKYRIFKLTLEKVWKEWDTVKWLVSWYRQAVQLPLTFMLHT